MPVSDDDAAADGGGGSGGSGSKSHCRCNGGSDGGSGSSSGSHPPRRWRQPSKSHAATFNTHPNLPPPRWLTQAIRQGLISSSCNSLRGELRALRAAMPSLQPTASAVHLPSAPLEARLGGALVRGPLPSSGPQRPTDLRKLFRPANRAMRLEYDVLSSRHRLLRRSTSR